MTSMLILLIGLAFSPNYSIQLEAPPLRETSMRKSAIVLIPPQFELRVDGKRQRLDLRDKLALIKEHQDKTAGLKFCHIEHLADFETLCETSFRVDLYLYVENLGADTEVEKLLDALGDYSFYKLSSYWIYSEGRIDSLVRSSPLETEPEYAESPVAELPYLLNPDFRMSLRADEEWPDTYEEYEDLATRHFQDALESEYTPIGTLHKFYPEKVYERLAQLKALSQPETPAFVKSLNMRLMKELEGSLERDEVATEAFKLAQLESQLLRALHRSRLELAKRWYQQIQ